MRIEEQDLHTNISFDVQGNENQHMLRNKTACFFYLVLNLLFSTSLH